MHHWTIFGKNKSLKPDSKDQILKDSEFLTLILIPFDLLFVSRVGLPYCCMCLDAFQQ